MSGDNQKRVHRKVSTMAKELEYNAFLQRLDKPSEEMLRITATFANYIPDMVMLKHCLVQVINEKEITLSDYNQSPKTMAQSLNFLKEMRQKVNSIDDMGNGQALSNHVMRQPYVYQESLLRSILDEAYYQGELNARSLYVPEGDSGRVPKEQLIQALLLKLEPVLMFKNPFKPCPQKAKDEYSAYIRNMESMLQKLPDFLKEK